MAVVVLGATLADAEAFCERNPDFSRARRTSVMSDYPKEFVDGFVVTPAAWKLMGARRSYMVKHAKVLARNLLRSWGGIRG